MIRTLRALPVLFLLAAPAWGQAHSAADLEGFCELVGNDSDEFFESGDVIEATACIGYFNGYLDAAGMLSALNGNNFFCIPEGGISNDQARRIFLKFVSDNPEHLHNGAHVVIAAALSLAFPCPSE